MGLIFIELPVRGMHSGFPFKLVPAWNYFWCWRIFKNLEQRASIHILANWKTEQSQDRGGNIDTTRVVNPFILLYPGTGRDKDPILSMPDCRTRRLAGNATRALRPGFKTVVRTDN